jgi:hypothetical protein
LARWHRKKGMIKDIIIPFPGGKTNRPDRAAPGLINGARAGLAYLAAATDGTFSVNRINQDGSVSFSWTRNFLLMVSNTAMVVITGTHNIVLDDALAAAMAISDESARAHALAALAPLLPETERETVLRDALGAATAISDESARADALAALARLLPET